IIKHIDETDITSLHSVALLNRTWCRHSIPVLWKKPFCLRDSVTNLHMIIPIYLSFLSDETKINLNIDGMRLSTKASFNYPEFVHELDFIGLQMTVYRWWSRYNRDEWDDDSDEEEDRYYDSEDEDDDEEADYETQERSVAISEEIFKLVVDRSKKLDSFTIDLKDNSRWSPNEFDHYLTVLFSSFGMTEWLKKLRVLKLTGPFPKSTFLKDILSVNRNLSILTIEDRKNDEALNYDLSDFIKTQHNLKEFSFVSNSEDVSPMLAALTERASSLRKIQITNGVILENLIIETLTQCSQLESICFQSLRLSRNQLKPFSRTSFPKLNSLYLMDIDLAWTEKETKKSKDKTMQNIIRTYGPRLENLGLRINLAAYTGVLESVAKSCGNLKTFVTRIETAKEIPKLFDVLKSCRKFESLIIHETHCTNLFEANDIMFEMAGLIPSTLVHLDLTKWVISIEILVGFLMSCNARLRTLTCHCHGSSIGKEDMIRNSHPSPEKPPLFDYPSFCRTLTISHVGHFWNFEEEADVIEHDYKVYLIKQELYKLFISRSPRIRRLTHTIHLTHFPGASSCLFPLVEFVCDTNLPHDILYGMAQICKNLKKLIIKQYHDDNQALSKLIKSQTDLRHVEIDTEVECDPGDYGDYVYSNIGHALTTVAQSIRHLSLGGSRPCILMYTMKYYVNLRSIRLFHCGEDADEMMEMLSRVNFSSLGILEVDYEAPTLLSLTKFVLNNGTNLEEISLYCLIPPDPEHSILFNRAVAQRCRKLEFLSSFFVDTEFRDLKEILVNCTHLRGLYIRTGNIRLNGDTLLDMLQQFAPPQLSRLCVGGEWEFTTERLKEFLEHVWRKDGRQITIYHHYENIIDEEKEDAFEFSEEQGDIIKTYQMSSFDLGLVGLKEMFSCEWNPFYYDFSRY
ncbi:9819_t:CDS:2, partial [Acaulospora colombiana]